jgi:hypothetical protein
MIPNIKTGTSFRGAQLYYLHDKRAERELLRLSDKRVAWTEARNTAHDEIDEAFAEMVATFRDQDALKTMSGFRLSGRPCEEPVMTVSLAWHPSEKPGKEEMLRAADGYLKHMGWEDHQAVYVCHTDTAHPHLHIILNRIHPETGKVLDDAFSRNRSQEWARAYEQERGRVWCEERIGKDYGRADGREPNGLPHDFAIDARETQRGYAELEEAQRTLDKREKEQLAKHHQEEREAFFESRHKAFREARQASYQEVRAEYKPRWVEHFREAEHLRKEAEQGAATLAVKVLHHAAAGDFEIAWELLSDREALTRNAENDIAEARRHLRGLQRTETRERQDEACAALYHERAAAYAQIKQRQKEERAELRDLQSARAAAEPYDKERLAEMVTEPVSTRLPDILDHAQPAQDKTVEIQKSDSSSLAGLAAELTEKVDAGLEPLNLGDERGTGVDIPQREPDAGGVSAVTGTADAMAGGIGKLAEVLSDAMSGFINPKTPKEKAQDLAARTKEKPQREEPAPRPQGGGTSFSFDTYLGEHGARIRREQEEYWQKRREEKDNSNER